MTTNFDTIVQLIIDCFNVYLSNDSLHLTFVTQDACVVARWQVKRRSANIANFYGYTRTLLLQTCKCVYDGHRRTPMTVFYEIV